MGLFYLLTLYCVIPRGSRLDEAAAAVVVLWRRW